MSRVISKQKDLVSNLLAGLVAVLAYRHLGPKYFGSKHPRRNVAARFLLGKSFSIADPAGYLVQCFLRDGKSVLKMDGDRTRPTHRLRRPIIFSHQAHKARGFLPRSQATQAVGGKR
ncbi:hypothetical protein CEXT_592741 [Caerostris extrusa]|uniref:Uncharacterized protein n=1 Tax=Caerostris extrusa TaxID=172846 RepID=A0AAV4WQ47_CAEEX|nr:hypothetical protein CEXT_592741 [Caerostris extrusa]